MSELIDKLRAAAEAEFAAFRSNVPTLDDSETPVLTVEVPVVPVTKLIGCAEVWDNEEFKQHLHGKPSHLMSDSHGGSGLSFIKNRFRFSSSGTRVRELL